jgi:hypothetical protein
MDSMPIQCGIAGAVTHRAMHPLDDMNIHPFKLLGAILLAALAGCAGIVGEKRHSPAEIASYKPADFVAPIASIDGERVAVAERSERIRLGLSQLTLPVNGDEDSGAPGALWAIAFLNAERTQGLSILQNALIDIDQKPVGFQRAVLSAAYTMYAREAASALAPLLDRINTPREFAITAYAILKADAAINEPDLRARLRAKLVARFPDWASEARLVALEHTLTTDLTAERLARPPLIELLAAPFRPGLPVIFSFQRPDRKRVGLAMVRGADGRFVRNADGSFFNIAHLALALSNLPGTITNGNTPQGLFTIVGAGTATNPWIGPTPYLHAKVPKEASVAEYEHSDVYIDINAAWSEVRYESFLPPAWRGYFPFKEAWLAGLAGRDDMLLHGTTINPEYYRNDPYYPGTPSAGCLVAMEYWSKADGRLMHSDQLTLAKAFTAGGIDQGYLVVVELDDRPAPVNLADVVKDVIDAEVRARQTH